MSVEIRKVKNLDKILFDATKAGILETCVRIATEAKNLQEPDTGRLRNSIMYRTADTEGGLNNRPGDLARNKITPDPKQNEGYIGSNLEYAIYQEFGTRRMFAQPFLRPAAHLVSGRDKSEILNKIKTNAYDNIRKTSLEKEATR